MTGCRGRRRRHDPQTRLVRVRRFAECRRRPSHVGMRAHGGISECLLDLRRRHGLGRRRPRDPQHCERIWRASAGFCYRCGGQVPLPGAGRRTAGKAPCSEPSCWRHRRDRCVLLKSVSGYCWHHSEHCARPRRSIFCSSSRGKCSSGGTSNTAESNGSTSRRSKRAQRHPPRPCSATAHRRAPSNPRRSLACDPRQPFRRTSDSDRHHRWRHFAQRRRNQTRKRNRHHKPAQTGKATSVL